MRSKEIENYKKGLKLSDVQREVLVGVLLGDAHLETKNGGQSYRIKFEQSIKHKPYLDHLYMVFDGWVRTPPKEKLKRIETRENWNVWFQTLSHPSLRFYGQQFYNMNCKRVPPLINRLLTPRALAYWFMDDGSIKSKQSKAIIFNTHAFSTKCVENLCEVLKDKFGLLAKPRKQKDGLQIFVSGASFEVFFGLVGKFVIPEMKYKIPKARQTHVPKK